MKHVYALLIKFLMIMVILEIVLILMTTLSFSTILVISFAVTLLAYLIGDLIILPISNNIVATLADFVLVLVILYTLPAWTNYAGILPSQAFLCAALIGVGEWFFHKYLTRTVYPDRGKSVHR